MPSRVCAQGDGLERIAILDLLSSLVDRSLVVAEERGPAVRYRLLETIRQYASERLVEAREQEMLRDRHRDAYLALAERAASYLAGHREWLEVLDAEAGNLDAALERALQTDRERGGAALCVRLSLVAAARVVRRRGARLCAGARCRRPVSLAAARSGPLRLRLLAGEWRQVRSGDRDRAAGARDGTGGDDQSAQARALNVLGLIESFPDPVGSRSRLERACELARASGDDWCFVDACLNLAWTHQQICDEHEEGERLRSEVLQLAERNGYRDYVSWYWLMECWRPLMRGEADRFRVLVERALVVAREIGEPMTEATGEMWIAWREVEEGHAEDALERVQAARERMVAGGAGLVLPYLEASIARVRVALGELDRARVVLEPLVASGMDSGWGLGWTTFALAEVLLDRGRPDRRRGACARGTRDRRAHQLTASDRLEQGSARPPMYGARGVRRVRDASTRGALATSGMGAVPGLAADARRARRTRGQSR